MPIERIPTTSSLVAPDNSPRNSSEAARSSAPTVSKVSCQYWAVQVPSAFTKMTSPDSASGAARPDLSPIPTQSCQPTTASGFSAARRQRAQAVPRRLGVFSTGQHPLYRPPTSDHPRVCVAIISVVVSVQERKRSPTLFISQRASASSSFRGKDTRRDRRSPPLSAGRSFTATRTRAHSSHPLITADGHHPAAIDPPIIHPFLHHFLAITSSSTAGLDPRRPSSQRSTVPAPAVQRHPPATRVDACRIAHVSAVSGEEPAVFMRQPRANSRLRRSADHHSTTDPTDESAPRESIPATNRSPSKYIAGLDDCMMPLPA